MKSRIAAFATEVGAGKIEVYNEFSLQHELGIYLRQQLVGKKVQFERNVSYFGLDKSRFVKRELDIAIFESNAQNKPETAIELKFPRNGQYPETMFSICQDISFAEQLKHACFSSAYVVIFAEDHNFYDGKAEGIYSFFRSCKNLSGTITKPTGKRDKSVYVGGNYTISWHSIFGSLKYAVVEVQ